MAVTVLPSNRQTGDILTKTYCGKVVANLILSNVPSKKFSKYWYFSGNTWKCFHGNQHPSSIKHSFISLYSKYQSLKFICIPIMNSPVFLSLDNIYCIHIVFHISQFFPFLALDAKLNFFGINKRLYSRDMKITQRQNHIKKGYRIHTQEKNKST